MGVNDDSGYLVQWNTTDLLGTCTYSQETSLARQMPPVRCNIHDLVHLSPSKPLEGWHMLAIRATPVRWAAITKTADFIDENAADARLVHRARTHPEKSKNII